MDVVYERMKDDCEQYSKPENTCESQIRKFYAGKTILLTGSTGYVGTCVMEKLLRTCSELDKIYTLVRPKKQMSVEERMKKYFSNVIFDRLRKEHPNFQDKVVTIQGDLIKPDLGISPEDRRLLTENVDIIIHNAANVYFQANISVSLKINVLATQKLLELGEECAHLKAFMYVSTAYSHCYVKTIEEKFYRPPADLKMIEDMIKADTENAAGITDEAIDDMRGQWPNNYVFTKAAAEGLVEKFGRKASFPCGVFRPSIVVPTYEEPIRYWSGNVNGPVSMQIGATLGIVHVTYVDKNPILDIIPADMTANSLLATIWDLAVYRKPKEPRVYNYASSTLHPFYLLDLHEPYSIDKPSMKSAWYFFFVITGNIYVFYVLHLLFHFIPALLVDFVLLMQGKKTFAVQTFLKFSKHMTALFKFTNGDWRIETRAIQDIWTRMNPADLKEFNFDVRQIEWTEFFNDSWTGLRVYLLNDPMDTLPAAKKKYKRLQIMHYTLVGILSLIFAYYVYKLACFVFSF